MCFRRESSRRSWDLTAATYPHMAGEKNRRQIQSSVRRLQHVGQELASALEQVDDAARIEMIGGMAKRAAGGPQRLNGRKLADWRRRHRRQMDWLQSRGVSLEEAVRRHEASLAREKSHDFWAGKSSKGVGRRAGRKKRGR